MNSLWQRHAAVARLNVCFRSTRRPAFNVEPQHQIPHEELGDRSHAHYTTRGDSGRPALYDPAGSYGAANGGGSSGLVTGEAASIAKFKDFHKGQVVESTCKETSEKEERNIINAAMDLPSAAPFECAVMSSSALSGQPSFPHVEAGTIFPGNLLRQFRRGP